MNEARPQLIKTIRMKHTCSLIIMANRLSEQGIWKNLKQIVRSPDREKYYPAYIAA